MSKQKSRKQLASTNNYKGNAKDKHKTVIKETKIEITGDYPAELIHEPQRMYYDCLLQSCNLMAQIFHDVDKFMIAQIAEQMVIRDTLLREFRERPIINEQNGNTMVWQTKPNPAGKMYLDFDRQIAANLTKVGLTVTARADIINKLSVLKSEDVVDEKTAKAIANDVMQIGKYKPKKQA